MMDEQELRKGEDYAVLPDSYVVMICPQDLFHQGRHIYRFRNYEQTDRNLELRDGTTKVFLNTHGTGDDILPELKNFLNLINGNAPADDFCREVQEQVREAKKDAETRRNFMEFEYKQMLIAKDAREEGRKEGHTKEREKILDSMAAMVKSGRMRAEDVAEVLEVPVETVLAAAAKTEEKGVHET